MLRFFALVVGILALVGCYHRDYQAESMDGTLVGTDKLAIELTVGQCIAIKLQDVDNDDMADGPAIYALETTGTSDARIATVTATAVGWSADLRTEGAAETDTSAPIYMLCGVTAGTTELKLENAPGIGVVVQ